MMEETLIKKKYLIITEIMELANCWIKRIDYITNKLKLRVSDKDIFICLIYNSFWEKYVNRV